VSTQAWLLLQDLAAPQSAFVQQPPVGMQTVVVPVVHEIVDPVQL